MSNNTLTIQEGLDIGLIEIKLKTLAAEIKTNIKTTKKIGLLDGKMGVAIFLYELAGYFGNEKYESFADMLIDEIFEHINNNVVPYDFSGGLAGVAWGIEYLSKNKFVEGDTNEILSDLDDKIFQHYMSTGKTDNNTVEFIFGYGFYILSRYKKIKASNNDIQIYIYKRLIVDLVNYLSYCAESGLITTKEPLAFSLNWKLPLLLILLSEISNLQIYKDKVLKIVSQLSPSILSLLPVYHSNRLYLLLGMFCFFEQHRVLEWEDHIELLENSVDLNKIFTEEFYAKKINIFNGISGVFMILSQINRYLTVKKNFDFDFNFFLKKDMILNKNKPNTSIAYGLSGIGISLIQLLKLGKINVPYY